MSMLVTNGLVSAAVCQPIAQTTHYSHQNLPHSMQNINLTVCSIEYHFRPLQGKLNEISYLVLQSHFRICARVEL